MTLEEIINEYSKVVAMISAELASGLLDGSKLDKREREYELFKAGRDALLEKKMSMKG